MNFPNGRAPAGCCGARKTAVVLGVEVAIVSHQLPNHLHLLPLKGLDVINAPLGVAGSSCERRHLGDDAVFLQLAIQRFTLFGTNRERLAGKCRVKPEAYVIVEGIGSREPTVARFETRGPARGRTARILGKIDVRDNRVEVPFP